MSRKHRRSSREAQSSKPPAQPVALMWGGGSGYAATWDDPQSGTLYWPSLDEAGELNSSSLDKMWRKARALEANSGIAGILVDSVVSLLGWLAPRAKSSDAEWNKLAQKAFLDRALNCELFDVSGELNFFTAQLWAENRRCIDGDNLTVLTDAPDGGAGFAFYSAPHLQSPIKPNPGRIWQNGVMVNRSGKAIAYGVWDSVKGDATVIPRQNAILYSHTPDPRRKRGLSDLRRAIRHIHDEAEIIGHFKKSVKLAATVGLYEVNNSLDRRAPAGRQPTLGAVDPVSGLERMFGAGKIVNLDPGKDLKILTDNRPSTQSMDLVRHLLDECVYGIGIDPGVIFTPDRLGSAGVRWVAQKLKRWLKIRLIHRHAWVNKIWRYTICREIKLGRLPAPKDGQWYAVDWVPMESMTIDVGRDGKLAMDLVEAGMADLDDWTLSTTGKTFEELVERKAWHIAKLHEAAARHGVSPLEVMPALAKAVTAAGDQAQLAPDPADLDEPDDDDATDNSAG